MSDEAGDDSPPRPKRKIKKVLLVSSSSESDSDESIAAGTRRKRLRVVSDDGSESSGSSVVAGVRRNRPLPKLRDSDGDSDTSGWATDHSDAQKPAPSAPQPPSGFASDSSEGNSDKCSICLLRFTNQEIGTPQSCEHIFCLDCITEWSRNVNTCPVDRMTFDSIVVRSGIGGRVLRTEPVKVVERRPSIEMLVTEDPTVCEVCGSTDNEETMLLCDGCDLGYHMQCLTPPLTEIPPDQWLCPNCHELLPDVDTLYSGITDADIDMFLDSRRSSRESRVVAEEPSTSSGRRGSRLASADLPSTSRGTTSRASSSRNTTSRRRTATYRTTRRRPKRRRTKTVIVEYEVEENGKFPVTKRVKRKLKKRKTKRRQPRTAARRSHVRQSVRAKLAALAAGAGGGARAGPPALRQRIAAPALSLFGDPLQLDFFSDDEELGGSERASTAVAARPSASAFSAYRQARRKMISVPSPPHGSAAPDILSSILESQALLHSRNSVVSITVDGSVNIKLEKSERTRREEPSKRDKVDLSQGEDSSRKAPSYPGQSRGGWGGGYRYREQSTNGNFGGNRGNNYDNGNFGAGGFPGRPGHSYGPGPGPGDGPRRGEGDAFNDYSRRPFPPDDEEFDRNRRQPPEPNRGSNAGRYGAGAAWQPYTPPAPRRAAPPAHRHSFGGFDNPLDMRVGHIPRHGSLDQPPAAQPAKRPPYRPLPEPPMFQFEKPPELDKSEDERSDPDLVIDTEKYDPTEPTNDDDDEGAAAAVPPLPPPPAPPLDGPPSAVQSILAGLDTSGMHVPAGVLDSAVRQVLHEHRALLAPGPPPRRPGPSDDDSDGDCPNFSIYSATSVHIANSSNAPVDALQPPPGDGMEDLVQQDDTPATTPEAGSTPDAEPLATPLKYSPDNNAAKNKKSDEELKEKISKRCPITTNPRHPIKIKLHTPSLIKRQVSLYDDEEEAEREPEPADDEPKHSEDVTEHKSDTIEMEIGQIKELDKASDTESVREDTETNKQGSPRTPRDRVSKSDDEPTGDAAMDVDEERDRREAPSEDEEDKASETRDDSPDTNDKPDKDAHSDDSDSDDLSEEDLPPTSPAGKEAAEPDDNVEKMTESISETEDERSYTPCLDENKSKDTSLETDKDKGIEGLDTEMISEDEGNEMFSEGDRSPPSEPEPEPASGPGPGPDPATAPAPAGEDGEILDADRRRARPDEPKKKRKKDSKKEGKEKKKAKKDKGDKEVAFKKLSKSGKERNYRDKDRDTEGKKRERRDSAEAERKQKRREKRKDLERYDVRSVVTEKRRRPKDAFGRDVSPRSPSPAPAPPPAARSASPPPPLRRRSTSPPIRRRSSSRPRRSVSRPRRSISRPLRSISRPRRSISRARRSISRVRRSISRARGSPTPLRRRSPSRGRATPPRVRRSMSRPRPSPLRRRAVSSPRRARPSPSPAPPSPRLISPARVMRRRRRSSDKRPEVRRRRSAERRKRRRSGSGSRSPRPKPTKRKKRVRPSRSPSRGRSARRRSPRRRRAKRRSVGRTPSPAPMLPIDAVARSPGSVDSRLLSPRTPPPEPSPPPPEEARRRRRDPERARHRRVRDAAGPSKEVFTSGDNILVSVSFQEPERAEGESRREKRRERRRRRKRAAAEQPEAAAARPVAIIDLERSPFRELTPSPRDVIVLSDSEPGEKEAAGAGAGAAPPAGASAPGDAPLGPQTPPAPATPPEPPDSPDAYDPFEPTRSASPSPSPSPPPTSPRPAPAEAPPTHMTLESAQKTNMSADEVLDRRPLSPIEKVMALLQSTRDVSPEPPPGDSGAEGPAPPAAAPAPAAPPALIPALIVPLAPPAPAPAPPIRIVLPSPTRSQPPKLFLAKPSPIKSDPIKPMQATKIARALPPAWARGAGGGAGGGAGSASPAGADSPYSPGSSDFGDLFEPPGAGAVFDALLDRPQRNRKSNNSAAKVPVKLNKKKGKTQVGVKIDEDNLKILDDLPSSAVEMQVKSKFLKKLNRQERVVEEVKLVLKPHYNKKHVSKDQYKDILRRAVPKICHNKTGEINPAKIQALVEAYVKKFRKKHKPGLL